ncbi:hypothetical protein HDU98_010171 [Podochytrium sp. JEL0797]|nr:hypothetical protein HDU98_010171 [Podochytrium sp. JEL0797]
MTDSSGAAPSGAIATPVQPISNDSDEIEFDEPERKPREQETPQSVRFATMPVSFPASGKQTPKPPASLLPVGHPSSAVTTMKATAAMKDQDALNYMKKFKIPRQPVVNVSVSKAPKFPSLLVLENATKKNKAKSVDEGLPELSAETHARPKSILLPLWMKILRKVISRATSGNGPSHDESNIRPLLKMK